MSVNKIKSWYFSLGTVIIQAVFLIYWVVMSLSTPLPNPNDDLSSANAAPSLFAGFSFAILVLLLIPTILLKINTDRSSRLGRTLSQIFAVLALSDLLLVLIGYVRFGGTVNVYTIIYGLQFIQAAFLFAAAYRQNTALSKLSQEI